MLYMNMHYLFLAVLCFLDAFHNECYGIAVLFFIQVIDIFGSLAGATNVGFERVHGGFGYGSRSQEGEDVLNFALAYNC